VSAAGVRRIEFAPLPHGTETPVATPENSAPFLTDTVEQLREYFAGQRTAFDLPLDTSTATAFQATVYEELLRVPYGHVITYGELARRVGRPGGARAVGQAVGANPIPIVIPCHRVVSGAGRLGGFSGGLPNKVVLLRLEGVEVDGATPTSRVHPEVIPLRL